MLPERTTTIGEDESVMTERPFQSMKAVERTRAKLRTWAASWRGCMPEREESIVVVVVVVVEWWAILVLLWSLVLNGKSVNARCSFT